MVIVDRKVMSSVTSIISSSSWHRAENAAKLDAAVEGWGVVGSAEGMELNEGIKLKVGCPVGKEGLVAHFCTDKMRLRTESTHISQTNIM